MSDSRDADRDLKPEQVAERLQVHEATVRRWLREGKAFPHAYRLPSGRGWRIPVADVEALRNRGPERSE